MGWYRTALRGPVGWESARLDLGRVRHYGRAYSDGAVGGEHYHLRMPWQLDLAGKVRPGEVCELTIFTHNCSGRYAHPDVDELSEGAAQAIDTLFWYTSAATIGMEGDVWLCIEDAVRLEDMYVVTSVRERTIRVEAEVCNDGAADFAGAVAWRVERGGQPVLDLPEQRVAIAAGQTQAELLTRPVVYPHSRLRAASAGSHRDFGAVRVEVEVHPDRIRPDIDRSIVELIVNNATALTVYVHPAQGSVGVALYSEATDATSAACAAAVQAQLELWDLDSAPLSNRTTKTDDRDSVAPAKLKIKTWGLIDFLFNH